VIVDYKLGKYKIKVFPEAYASSYRSLVRKGFISIGGLNNKHLEVVMVNDKGEILDRRGKVVLTRADKRYGYEAGNEFRTFQLGKYRILSIICYEICFPRIWKQIKGKISLVTHHIGFPMYNEKQAKTWRKLQWEVVKYFKCDLVCSVGRWKEIKGIDISGIIRWRGKDDK